MHNTQIYMYIHNTMVTRIIKFPGKCLRTLVNIKVGITIKSYTLCHTRPHHFRACPLPQAPLFAGLSVFSATILKPSMIFSYLRLVRIHLIQGAAWSYTMSLSNCICREDISSIATRALPISNAGQQNASH